MPLVDLLIAHREAFPSPELVFTNSIGGPVGRTSFRTRKWKPATPTEVEEAERRLILHDFPIRDRLERAAGNPPSWVVDSALTDEDER